MYWLELCSIAPHYPKNEDLISRLADIQHILSSIINKTKQKLKNLGSPQI